MNANIASSLEAAIRKESSIEDITETGIEEAASAAAAETERLMKLAYEAGRSEGMDSSSSFEWGIRRRDVSFEEWLEDNANTL